VLKGSELDTRFGHFLVYGVNDGLTSDIDFTDVKLDARELMKAARHHGAIALPAHPGRFGIGLVDYMASGEEFPDVNIVERLNGGSRAGENERAAELCQEKGYLGIGCSDAHLASHICTCVTNFQADIRNEQGLVEALLSGDFSPAWLEDTKEIQD
jgi:predicted metal-dependent phosphoesterase TrpH